MKNVCFMGAFEKLDLLLYISKVINSLGKKVLIVDSTQLQKAKYVVPSINPTKSYITRFENIDIAVGFQSYEEIEKYIGFIEGRELKYDYAFVDIDKSENFDRFNNKDTIKNYFVTSFELYSIKKGLETIANIKKPVKVTKILFSSDINENDDYYLEYLSLGYKIIWEQNKINFPYDINNIEVMIENEKVFKVRLKGLTQEYKESMVYLIKDIIPSESLANLNRIIKNIEKEV